MKNWKWWHWVLAGLVLWILIMSLRAHRVQPPQAPMATVRDLPPHERERIEREALVKNLKHIGSRNYLEAQQGDASLWMNVINQLEADRALIAQASRAEQDSIRKLAAEAGNNLSVAQQKLYPKLRAQWVKRSAQALWTDDIYVEHYGTTVFFTGALFVRNSNKQTFQEKLLPQLTQLRFKQAQYRWYKNQEDYVFYTIESKADSDISR